MSNELAKKETTEVAAIGGADFFADLADELDGLGAVNFDTIKIPSGGGLAFEVPGDDPESPDVAKEIVGTIVHRQSTNGYWPEAFGGDNKTPACYSNDGKNGVDSTTGECKDCATCPHNQFKDAGGKDCKNMQNLFIIRDGDMFPIRLVLPPTSIKNYREYISKRLMFRGRKQSQVITKITLAKAQSKQGITYAVAQFAKVRDLTPEECAAVAPVKNLVAQVLAAQSHAPAADYEEIVSDEPLPFDS